MPIIKSSGIVKRSYHQKGNTTQVGNLLPEFILMGLCCKVSLRFWVCNERPKYDDKQVKANFTYEMLGVPVSDIDAGTTHYSEYTTEEYCNVTCKLGGHDISSLLASYKDKWMLIEIEY